MRQRDIEETLSHSLGGGKGWKGGAAIGVREAHSQPKERDLSLSFSARRVGGARDHIRKRKEKRSRVGERRRSRS